MASGMQMQIPDRKRFFIFKKNKGQSTLAFVKLKDVFILITRVLLERWHSINTAQDNLLFRDRIVFTHTGFERSSDKIRAPVFFSCQVFVNRLCGDTPT